MERLENDKNNPIEPATTKGDIYEIIRFVIIGYLNKTPNNAIKVANMLVYIYI